MDATIRNNIRERWLRLLFQFIDIGYQKRVWLEAFYPDVVSSYTEAVCAYFDDLDLNEGYDGIVSQGFASAEEVAIVTSFHQMLGNYSTTKKEFDDKEVLSDPEWHEVARLGFATWQALKTHLTGTPEYDYMQELEEKFL